MKPFSTPVLSKRTYRELKLLKHITHENVSTLFSSPTTGVPHVHLVMGMLREVVVKGFAVA